MVLLVLIGNLAFTICSLVLGIRLCRLARRTRQLPELLMGISFLTGGVFGHTLGFLQYMLKPEGFWLTVMTLTLRTGASVACVLVAVMAWKVFRAHESWAKVLVGVEVVLLLSYVLRDFLIGRLPLEELIKQPLYWTSAIALITPYVWIAWESLRYQALIKRRWRVGLPADLVMARRILLWGIGLGAIGGMLLGLDVLRVLRVLTGVVISQGLLVSGLGLVCSISLWLAFFLPESYVKQLEQRSAAPPA